jgi:hypothetical protein
MHKPMVENSNLLDLGDQTRLNTARAETRPDVANSRGQDRLDASDVRKSQNLARFSQLPCQRVAADVRRDDCTSDRSRLTAPRLEMKATKDDSAGIVEVRLELDSQHFEFAFGQDPTVDNGLTEDITKVRSPAR